MFKIFVLHSSHDRKTKTAFARRLRREDTKAEALFWREVRGRHLGGYKFRRQVSIGNYFADFVCESAKLIVEFDGDQHAEMLEETQVEPQSLKNMATASFGFGMGICLKTLTGLWMRFCRSLHWQHRNPSPALPAHLSLKERLGLCRSRRKLNVPALSLSPRT